MAPESIITLYLSTVLKDIEKNIMAQHASGGRVTTKNCRNFLRILTMDNQIQMAGHSMRMDDEKIPKKILLLQLRREESCDCDGWME